MISGCVSEDVFSLACGDERNQPEDELSRKKVTGLPSYKGNLHYMQRYKSAEKPKIPLYVIGEGKWTELKTSAPFFWWDYGERKAESFLSSLEEQLTVSYGMEPLAKCHEDIMALGRG